MSELKESVALHFKSNPSVDTFHATKDGQCFENEHTAFQHGRTLGSNDSDKEVKTFKRADVLGESNEGATKGKNAKEAIQDIKAAETVEAIAQYLNDERSSVKEAAEKRTAELSK